MNPAAKYPIGPFVELGRILQQELDEGRLDPVIRRATEANCWFTAESVAFAIAAQNEMSAFHTKIFWKVDGKAHSLTGSNRTKRLFKGGQSAVINTKVHKRIPFQKV